MAYHLVLSGSGARFTSFVGVYEVLLKQYPDFEEKLRSVIATSGGAVIGCMICLGYSVGAIKQLCTQIRYDHVAALNVSSFFDTYGFDDGTSFVKLFKVMIEKKLGDAEATFEQLKKKTNRDLKI